MMVITPAGITVRRRIMQAEADAQAWATTLPRRLLEGRRVTSDAGGLCAEVLVCDARLAGRHRRDACRCRF